MKRKSKPIRIVREKWKESSLPGTYAVEPKGWEPCGCAAGYITSFCAHDFEALTGIILSQGESTYIQVVEIAAPRKPAKKPAKKAAKRTAKK